MSNFDELGRFGYNDGLLFVYHCFVLFRVHNRVIISFFNVLENTLSEVFEVMLRGRSSQSLGPANKT